MVLGVTWPPFVVQGRDLGLALFISLGDSGAVYMGLVDGSVVNPKPGVPETSPLTLLLVEKVVDGTCIVKQGSGLTAHLSWTLH